MIRKLMAPVGIAAAALGMAAGTAVPASAANNIKPFGTQETLNDCCNGAPMIGYTVMALSPSSDPVPHNGQLYAAPVKVDGLGGWAVPLVPLFNARAESGANYRVIGGGVPPAPPGGSTTGTLYFDVVGDPPNSVVYNDGVQDLLVWVPGPLERGTNTTGNPFLNAPGESTEVIGGPPAAGAAEGPPPEAAPEVMAPPPYQLSEPEVATPGFNAEPGRGGGHR